MEKFRTWKDVVDIIIKDEQFMDELKQNIIEDINIYQRKTVQ